MRALKQEGVKTVLINPNVATYQTSSGVADKIYFLPVTPYFVEKVIKKEKPDGILLSFGGQTAINCGVELHDSGVLKKHGVEVLGTSVETIKATEDRELFARKLSEIGLKTPKSRAVKRSEDALVAARDLGYPVMIRGAYALGGLGSGACRNEEELRAMADKAFSHTEQILVEEYLNKWKEIEYEVVRDKYDNCITVCNMENFDPMGIHTGDSIVVAPSQTLSNREFHGLRDTAIRLIRHLGIVGECNVQYALDPHSEDYRIIEVNARLSRSSALASKATGYPLAFVAAKLALGYSLTEISNSITKRTAACFEPALDYVVVKVPRWDLKKFKNVSRNIGSQMKSVGEVMAIGRTFEEALQKAVRMLDIGAHGLVCNDFSFDVEKELACPSDERLFAVVEALKRGYGCDEVCKLTGINEWFLHKIKNVLDVESRLQACGFENVDRKLLLDAKKLGFSDKQLSLIFCNSYLDVKKKRDLFDIKPVVRQVDTLAGEFPAKTNYLYLTYGGESDDVEFETSKKAVVLGSGVYRIGSSVEFDWCCVNAAFTLKDSGYSTIMINYNPETVSTDYDVCDRLYFEEISFETVSEICEKERPEGAVVSVGGQTPNNLATKLEGAGIKLLGTSAKSIDSAENRFKFSKLLDELGIDQPRWKELTSFAEAKKFADEAGYPVLVRPSYVLSGAAMNVAFNPDDLEVFLGRASKISEDHPVVISKFISNSKELEIDAVARNGKIVADAISEHVENAGVHSGDATMVYPAQSLYEETVKEVKRIASAIAEKLRITGPFNVQFIANENKVLVIECNLRASRSLPFVSKVSNDNFIEIAVKAMLGKEQFELSKKFDHIGIKFPQFSFSRLSGADPILSVEMASTGEVGCLGSDLYDAFVKAFLAAGYGIPKKNVFLSLGGHENKKKFLEPARMLKEMGYELYATYNTSEFLRQNGIASKMLHKVSERKSPNVTEYLRSDKMDLIINVPEDYASDEMTDGYVIRRKAADFAIPLITNRQLAELFVKAMSNKKINDLEIKAWNDYWQDA